MDEEQVLGALNRSTQYWKRNSHCVRQRRGVYFDIPQWLWQVSGYDFKNYCTYLPKMNE